MALGAETQQATVQTDSPVPLGRRALAYLRSSVMTYPVARRRELATEIVQLIGVPALFAVLWFVRPPPTLVGAHETLGLPPCTMRLLFGIPCPACGGTTGLVLMLHGQIRMAFLASLLAPPAFVGLVGLWFQSAYSVGAARRVFWLRGPSTARTTVYTTVYILIAWAYKIVTYLYIMQQVREGNWPS